MYSSTFYDNLLWQDPLHQECLPDNISSLHTQTFLCLLLGLQLDGFLDCTITAATARIINLWKKFREIMSFLTSRAPDQMYASCIRSSMIYGNETRLLVADVGLTFQKTDMHSFNSLTQHQL